MNKLIIHKVRNPFMCRIGQFTQGERELCIGLDLKALTETDQFKCYIGNNREVYYKIKSSIPLTKGYKWKNPKGKDVMIVPLSWFDRTGIYKKEKLMEEQINLYQAYTKMPDHIRNEIRKKLGLPIKKGVDEHEN